MESFLEQWTCVHCTSENVSSSKDDGCVVCGLPSFWRCHCCTLFNPMSNRNCSACGLENKNKNNVKSHSNHNPNDSIDLIPDDYDWETELLKEKYLGKEGSNYYEQYELGLEKQVSFGKLSLSQKSQRLKSLHQNSFSADKANETKGLIPFIKSALEPQSKNNLAQTTLSFEGGRQSLVHGRDPNFPRHQPREWFLSGDTSHFSTDLGDMGWGCGFRNLQCVCSHLLLYPCFEKALFGGCSYVPTVPIIQEWFEKAWADGFDPEGAIHFHGDQKGDGGISFTRRYIGSSDCCALLRFFGVRARLVDFHSRKLPEAIFDTMVQEQKKKEASKKGKRKRISPYEPNSFLFDWVWQYFLSRQGNHFLPPLFVQHEGHSRTIVGIERSYGKRGNITLQNLLLFDTWQNGTNLRIDFRNRKLQKLRRGLHTFTCKEYQILFLDWGVMTDNEREQSKILNSEHAAVKDM